jgi:glycosyltransferase involved in cell wall biosynthesis
LKSFALPGYNEIRLVWNVWKIGSIIENMKPDAIHIATEGTLGITASAWCRGKGIPFTSSYHTKLPEYIKTRIKWFPLSLGYSFMHWLHRGSSAVLVTNESMKKELKGLHPNLVVWSRGVDTKVFHPIQKDYIGYPYILYVGRVSAEKNIEAFLDIGGAYHKKIVVGDGPDKARLEAKYPHAEFVGYKFGEELAYYYANAKCLVFPSKTDTFGIVMLEANACGCPVAAYPVTGPKDYVISGLNGYLSENLRHAVDMSYYLDKSKMIKHILDNYSWANTTDIFEENLVKLERWHNEI